MEMITCKCDQCKKNLFQTEQQFFIGTNPWDGDAPIYLCRECINFYEYKWNEEKQMWEPA